jgi:hypothetical protein
LKKDAARRDQTNSKVLDEIVEYTKAFWVFAVLDIDQGTYFRRLENIFKL